MRRLDLYRMGRSLQGAPGDERDKGRDSENGGRTRDRRLHLLEELRDLTGGEILTGGGGLLLRIERLFPFDYRHGGVSLQEIHGHESRQVETLFPVVRDHAAGCPSPEDLLFFDIETTGLSGGAGTYLFLIGMLRPGDEGLRFVQLFMHSLSSERLLLQEVGRELRESGFLVSYNGRSYDYNILRNRYILNGVTFFQQEPVHLDLLYTSRRIWRGLFPDFTLATVERRALELRRLDDIPGWRIPEVYADYLRGREVCRDILRIIAHNRDDVLSLAALFGKQLRLIGEAAGSSEEASYDPVALSDMLINGRREAEAHTILSAHSDSGRARMHLALLCKRQRQFDEALFHLEKLCAEQVGLRDYLFACTEAAKILEHRIGDFENALLYTRRMLIRLERARYFKTDDGYAEQAKRQIVHRMNRLQRKLGKWVERQEGL
jgi:uncharacterized protein YprB with RNaseH-like and TPR domain